MPRVLIVDDEADLLEVARVFFEADGWEVVCVSTSAEAVAAARRGPWDLVLTDVQLPDRTGLEAVGELVAAARAPVWLMSGHADSELERDARLLGASGTIAKPFDFPALRRRLAERK